MTAAARKILIVDDHPLYREGMVSALRRSMPGIEVAGAPNAEEGLHSLSVALDTDLVLIDIGLPGMDGFAALAWYAEAYPDVSRVIISGQDDATLVKRAFAAGASGFIHKSMAIEQVVAAIQCVLEGGVFQPEAVAHERRSQGLPQAGDGITLRQLEVLRLLGEGRTNKEIARTLEIAERTAKAHVAAIFETLGAENRTQAVIAGQRCGLLPAGGGRA